jgi:5,10-methylenetetrahydromethanopterin reductase
VAVLGLNLIPETPINAIVGLARCAELSGYERCRIYDEGLATRDVHIVSAAVAVATERLLIGPGITNPYTRHPAQSIAALASLDELSGGRAMIGIGAGGSLTLDPLGIERRRPLAAVEEFIVAARRLLTGQAVDLDGDTLTLRSARLDFGRPGIPIWLAGRGPRILELGGRVADGVILDFLHDATLTDSVARVREAAGGVGRDVALSYSTSVVMTDADLEAVRPHMTYRLVDTPAEVRGAIGLDDATVARIRAALGEGLDAAARLVRDEWVLPFVIHGDAVACRSRVAAICAEHDIEEFLLPVFHMPDPAEYIARVGDLLGP